MNYLRRFTLAAAALLLALAGGRAVAAAKPMAAAQMLKVNPADCASCHKGQKVLPEAHVATKGMAFKDCLACHEAGKGLRSRLPGSHLHALGGVRCGDCHDNLKKPQAAAVWKCTSCHEPKALAARTASVQPRNPHESRHFGVHSDCNSCHHQHVKSENACAKCHPFTFQVP